jgi:hypothetical protein
MTVPLLTFLSILFGVRNVRKIPYLTKTVKHYWQGGRKNEIEKRDEMERGR